MEMYENPSELTAEIPRVTEWTMEEDCRRAAGLAFEIGTSFSDFQECMADYNTFKSDTDRHLEAIATYQKGIEMQRTRVEELNDNVKNVMAVKGTIWESLGRLERDSSELSSELENLREEIQTKVQIEEPRALLHKETMAGSYARLERELGLLEQDENVKSGANCDERTRLMRLSEDLTGEKARRDTAAEAHQNLLADIEKTKVIFYEKVAARVGVEEEYVRTQTLYRELFYKKLPQSQEELVDARNQLDQLVAEYFRVQAKPNMAFLAAQRQEATPPVSQPPRLSPPSVIPKAGTILLGRSVTVDFSPISAGLNKT